MEWFSKKAKFYWLTFDELPDKVAVKPNETLLQAVLNEGIEFPHLCRVGSCGSCKCLLVSGTAKSLVDLSYVLSPEEIRRGFILPCQAMARTDCKLSVPSALMACDPYSDLDAIEWPDHD